MLDTHYPEAKASVAHFEVHHNREITTAIPWCENFRVTCQKKIPLSLRSLCGSHLQQFEQVSKQSLQHPVGIEMPYIRHLGVHVFLPRVVFEAGLREA